MPQLDTATYLPQLYWLAVCFVVLYWIITHMALPRIASVLQRRHDRIASELETAEDLRDQAKAALADYESRMEKAQSKAQAILAKAVEESTRRAAKRDAEISSRLSKELAETEKRVAAAKNKALGEIDEAAGKLAKAVAEKIVGGRVDGKLIGEVLNADSAGRKK